MHQFPDCLRVRLPAVQFAGQRYILLHVQHRNQIVKLIDQSHLPSAEDCQSVVIHTVDIRILYQHPAGSGPIHAPKHMHQRGLSAAGTAYHRHKFSLGHGQTHIVHRNHFIASFAVFFHQMFRSQNLHVITLPSLFLSRYFPFPVVLLV